MIYLISSQKESVKNYDFARQIFVSKIIYKRFFLDYFCAKNLIITSQNALISAQKNQIDLSNFKLFCIGAATAKFAANLGLNVRFFSKSAHADDFLPEILPLIKNQKSIFLKAKKTISDLDEKLQHLGYDVKGVVAYENQILPFASDERGEKFCQKILPGDCLIFLSPSGVENYAKLVNNFDAKLICIGKSSAKALQKYARNYTISHEANIDECIKLARNFALDRSKN